MRARSRRSSVRQGGTGQCWGTAEVGDPALFRCAANSVAIGLQVIEQVASSKQLPTNQRGTDKAEKHEPNQIHPEDYGMSVAYDQSIAASPK